MNPNYDDNTIDALIAASLRPLKDAPTDEEIEAIFRSTGDPSPEDEATIASARQALIQAMSGNEPSPSTSPEKSDCQQFAAMNRDNADNEFDAPSRDAIEEARRKALDELEDDDTPPADCEEEND